MLDMEICIGLDISHRIVRVLFRAALQPHRRESAAINDVMQNSFFE